ncbi:MAG: hypothetical protein FJ271_11185 [Planctomycetes bacterium]|nr:hypothetical protein [Planctomycetota bacterium]
MLERDHVLIDSWMALTCTAARHELSRAIRALPENAPLGTVVKLPAVGWCLAGPSLVVREGEDSSLLMTMRHVWRWSRSWTVRDADDRLIGRVHPRVLQNARGQLVARLEALRLPGHSRLVGIDDRELAHIEVRSDGSRTLLIAAAQDNNPFTRMLLLGAALVLP